MKLIHFLSGLRSPGKYLSGLFAAFFLLALSACSGHSAQINDTAHVLDNSLVQDAASKLPNSITIYTTSTFQGSQSAFQSSTAQQLDGHPDLIIIAIDTTHRYVYITRGTNVMLSRSSIDRAMNSFATRFGTDNYTGASLAALSSLQTTLVASQRTTNNKGFFANTFALCCCAIPLLLALLLFLLLTARRERRGRPRL